MKRLLVSIFIFYSFALPVLSQNKKGEQGYYAITNYKHEESPGHHQNWFITQDKKGFIYTANGNGVLEFDGASWRLIESPGLNSARTIVVDQNNIKWVGADRELGYLETDSLGFLQFKSIKDKIPSSHPLTANIWQIFPEKERVLFFADNMIYSWKDNHFNIIPHPGPIYREYQIHGKVYVQITGQGMFEMIGDTLQMIPNGTLFRNMYPVVALPYGQHAVLFATRASGLFIFSGTEITKLENEVEQYLQKNRLYAGCRLPDSSLAFATLNGGVIMMDMNGKRLKEITTKDGILNNQVHGMTVDRQNALWMALQTGISKVEPHLPYSFLDKRSGLEGTVAVITRHKGILYVGTYSGLYAMGDGTAVFRKIEEIETGCFSLLTIGNDLLAATSNGVFLISEKDVVEVKRLGGTRTLYQSERDKNRVYIGHLHGLSTIYFKDGQWQPEKDIDQIKADIFSITSDDSGVLWLGTSLHDVIKAEFYESNSPQQIRNFDLLKVEHYGDGLPEERPHVFLIEGELFITSNGANGPLFKFDVGSGKFFPETKFGNKFGIDSLLVYPIDYQNDGQYILLESMPDRGKQYHFSASRNDKGSYTVRRLFDERFRSTTESHTFWDNKDLLWLGGEGITKYDLKSKYNFKSSFKTHIRKVIVDQDSTIYGGNAGGYKSPTLSYSNGGLRFEFAAPSFTNPEANRYQYRLSGFDEKWSDWTNETKKDYTNLPEGHYQFMARTQNIYGDVGAVGSFKFEILAPWYRTWWAYLSYLLLFISLLFAMLQWRARQLKAKNEALEKLIAVRTSEVQHQANQLKIQAEKLVEQDRVKSRFFANISHEFRTPLTLIKGPIEQLEEHFDEKLSMENVKMIRRNANRVLHMVNQMLDLSKIDEGSLKLTPTEGDINKCIRTATSSFNSYAAQRNIDYRVQIPQNMFWASFDRDKLENVLYNLIGNAFKFSDEGSEISCDVQYAESGLRIQVSDSGKGIPEEKLPFIFDRFYQADSSYTKENEGSGIGLSLSKELVELMDGTITVSSELNKGSLFKIHLPIQEIRTGRKEPVEIEIQLQNTAYQQESFTLTRSEKRNIPYVLLVEDNPDMRYFIREQLTKSYRVQEAINGEIGLQKALANPPDLIITDLMMPKMDGIELCTKLKTDVFTSHIPVIMLTAKAGIENKIEGLETGADEYLTKPFDVNELLVRIKNLIEQRRKLRELFTNTEINVDPKKVTVTSIDQKFLEEVLTLLEDKFSDYNFDLSQMQKDLGMSKTQLHRKLKALTNEAPGELLRNFRLKRAAQLLSQKADTVTQIAYKVGFNNLSYFAKCFKELYGVAPSSYPMSDK